MVQIDIPLLEPLTDRFIATRRSKLSAADRSEVLRIAQGMSAKESATASGLSIETIRTRRKRIYQKLETRGSGDLLSSLLRLSLKLHACAETLDGAAHPTAVASTIEGDPVRT